MKKTRAALSLLALFCAACANYGAVAEVNRDNLAFLERLRKQTQDRSMFANAATGSGAAAMASARAAAVEAELARTFGVRRCNDSPPCRSALRYRLATIDAEFQVERDEELARGQGLARYQGELSKAITALEANGRDIQEYLELNRFERLFADVKGMNSEELKKIGGDLKAISQSLGGDR